MRKIILASATLLFIACGGNSTNNENTSQSEVKASDSKASSSKDGKSAKYDAKCFEAFNYDYSKMLTKEDVLKHVSVSNPDAIEVEFKETRSKYKEHNSYNIKWPSDRPDQTMDTYGLPLSDDNFVSIKIVDFERGNAEQALQSFDRAYGKLSEEEYRQMEARIDQQHKDKSEEERNNMKSLIRAREKSSYQPLPNVGTAAYWMRRVTSGIDHGVELYVLAGTVKFEVDVKVSADDKENVRIAALLAQEVLNKCK